MEIKIDNKKLLKFLFDVETKSGKIFDILLNILIVLSILAVMLESVQSFQAEYGLEFKIFEWLVTIIFTAEYFARIAYEKENYAFSLFGVIDLLTIIPTYLSIFVTGAQGFMVIRAMRLLRVFRILKLNRNSKQGKMIFEALKASKDKIIIFLYAILMIITIVGTIIYLVEGHKVGFENIPQCVYWALRKLTIMESSSHPVTHVGIAIESFVKLLAHIVLAVPTGIVTASILNSLRRSSNLLVCTNCNHAEHDFDAIFCKNCGTKVINKLEIDSELTPIDKKNLMANISVGQQFDNK